MPDINEIAQSIEQSPAARARLLADTLELLEGQGVDVSSTTWQNLVKADISSASSFAGSLAASTVVIIIGTGGGASRGPGTAASTVVVAIASAGQRPVGNVASTVVIAIASAGQRPVGNVASTVVVAIATAGQRPIGNVASTVVIAIASAGQRPVGVAGFGEAATESTPEGTIKFESLERLSEVSNALRQLADLVDAGQVEIGQEIGAAIRSIVEQQGS
jgi:hypothetical protein